MAENKDGAEKSEEATSKKQEQSREEGSVAKSVDLSSGILLLAAVLILYYYTPYFIDNFKLLFTELLQFNGYYLDTESTYFLFIFSLKFIAKITLPFFVALFVAALAVNIFQVGFHISGKSISPKFEKLNFFTNFMKTFFNTRKIVDLIKSLFKIFVLSAIAWYIVSGDIETIVRMTDADLIDQMSYLASLTFEILLKISLLVFALGIADYAYQKWQHNKDIMMTKQEVKEEYKQMEGDPIVKNRIRQAQRDAARQRMMEDVPKADFVVTNPTHYAVAIRYDQNIDKAPRVIAKGQRLMALKIKEIAIKHGIKIVEDPPLARLLFNTVEVDEYVPEKLFSAMVSIITTLDKFKKMVS